MAAFINDRVPGNLKDRTKPSAKNRFESYMRSFKTAFAWDGDRTGGQSGQGLTAKDIANGITTVSAKLDKICFQYERMKCLFQGRQNIDPSHRRWLNLNANVTIPTQTSDVDEIEDVLDEASSASADDENDPFDKAYWEANSNEDPGNLNRDQSELTQNDEPPRKRKQTSKAIDRRTSNVKKTKFQPSTAPEKRPVARKDFVSTYESGQLKLLDLKREKFEHSKEVRRMKMEQAMPETRANFVAQLMRDGHTLDSIKEAVSVAFGDNKEV
ncbi:hypothetical protein AC1031_010780 [Aphanomyces cochlioides]|nr:hypothetical protein AC1031_010780 [Aphanomyces cochlioides]